MKTKIIIILAIGIAFFVCMTHSVKATITDVYILPEVPKLDDVITISVSGVEPYSGVTITDSMFNIDGTSLGLDLYLKVGILPTPAPWLHSQDIGTLQPATYELTVRTFENSYVTDTYPLTFEVIPEPSTVLLFGLGGLMLRRC